MAIEIERKFLVNGDQWRSLASGITYRQGYICTKKEGVVRVRIVGDRGYLTIKGLSVGNSRAEFEYQIPLSDAQTMLETMCERPLIEKNRYIIKHGELIWEVDEFFGENAGLIIAEVELSTEEQVIELPEWVGIEVSHDARYFNANLIKYPFCQWTD
ncbi:adenylate cyclase [[Phormidium ambiguum] IAM M-71]|uniref:Adenylate cyclase n=1 Tax=[Phormidium ambiguum] IAM M-71 TaxID=454136 RepID=A0A1U7IQL7_9CYAN|nr:CYTH domain-containing protein [Phormidium ambiguum]OKH39633.1 adenylate cyclase [Phormidium ambiguum IAM M-71]